MPRLLPILSLAIAILSTGTPAFAGGKSDWEWYGWSTVKVSKCVASAGGVDCPGVRQKWDWKRDQWVEVAVSVNARAVSVFQRVTNKDRSDRDDVCVTVLFLDAAGETVLAHHQNWSSDPSSVTERQFSYPAAAWPQVASIAVGSKQCRQGPHQDDAIYAAVLAGLPR